MKTPAVAGNSGWNPADEAPPFLPARSPALSFVFRRWPSSIRVLGAETLHFLAPASESEVYRSVRFWMDSERKGTLRSSVEISDHATALRDWMRRRENGALRSWWKSFYGWRSPREFVGFNKIVKSNGLPHVEPFEVANMRLPDDISTDADVVLFHAWCEGVLKRAIPSENSLIEDHGNAIRTGLEKFCRSPWIAFALASPWMQPTAVLFPKIGYTDSCLRLQYLLKHPFEATDAELPYILASDMFKNARKRSMKHRAPGKLIAPPGNWYVGGSIAQALGPNFRRGSDWSGTRAPSSFKTTEKGA